MKSHVPPTHTQDFNNILLAEEEEEVKVPPPPPVWKKKNKNYKPDSRCTFKPTTIRIGKKTTYN